MKHRNDDDDDYRERARERAQTIGNKRFKLAQGDTCLRLLRTPKSKRTPSRFYEYAVHYEVGPQKRSMRCGIDPQSGKGSCWLCEVQIPKLREMGRDSRASKLEPKNVFTVQIATVTAKRGKLTFRGPIVFQPTAQRIIKQILGLFASVKRSYDDPKKGYNVTISREGEGLNTTYGMMETDQDPSRVPSEIIGKLKPFSELKEIPIYEERAMKAAYRGIEDDEDDNLRRRAAGRKADADDDGDDDDGDDADDDDADDDDDDDEKPAKKKSKVAAKKAAPAKKRKVPPFKKK